MVVQKRTVKWYSLKRDVGVAQVRKERPGGKKRRLPGEEQMLGILLV